MKDDSRRLAIAGLGVLGIADSLYMLAYHEGAVDSMACPLFGEGCNAAGRSEYSRHFGVPNAAVGAAAYAAMGALALWRRKKPGKRAWQAKALAGIAAGAAGASAFLTWEQATRLRAWCFWCLVSAGINAAILPLALAEAATDGES